VTSTVSPTFAPIVSAEGVLRRMVGFPADALPTEAFQYSRKTMYLNGEAIEVLRQPAAHTDSDVFVFFRRSDVVATYTPRLRSVSAAFAHASASLLRRNVRVRGASPRKRTFTR